MNRVSICLLFLLFLAKISLGQGTITSITTTEISSQKIGNVITLQGNWNKSSDSTKARFSGNNGRLPLHFNSFIKQAKTNFWSTNYNAEISFKVTTTGEVDSILILNSTGTPFFNDYIKRMIASTSGKWMPAKSGNELKSETLNAWIFFVSGEPMDKPVKAYIEKIQKYLTENDYKKALKACDKILSIEPCNSTVAVLKAKALIGLNQTEESCLLLTDFKKYNIPEIDKFFAQTCKQ